MMRGVVWPAVLAVLLMLTGIVLAIDEQSLALSLTCSVGGLTMAVLCIREDR